MNVSKLKLGIALFIVSALVGSLVALASKNHELKEGLNKCLDLLVVQDLKHPEVKVDQPKPEVKK